MSVSDSEPDYADDTARVDVADDLEEVMAEALRKFVNGRVRDEGKERVRQQWLHAYVSAAKEYRQLVGDIEAKEQEDRIQRLEEMVEENI